MSDECVTVEIRILVRMNILANILESEGVFVLRGTEDCSTCSLSVIPDEAEKYVFWHEQDVAAWKNNIARVRYAQNRELAKRIVELGKLLGFEVEWDGSLSRTINFHLD